MNRAGGRNGPRGKAGKSTGPGAVRKRRAVTAEYLRSSNKYKNKTILTRFSLCVCTHTGLTLKCTWVEINGERKQAQKQIGSAL